jgi:hypothetical protein
MRSQARLRLHSRGQVLIAPEGRATLPEDAKTMQSRQCVGLRLAISLGFASLAALKLQSGHSPDYAISAITYWLAVSLECGVAVSCWVLPLMTLGGVVTGLTAAAILVGFLIEGPCGCLGDAFESERAAALAVAGLGGLLGVACLSRGAKVTGESVDGN